MRLLVCGGRDLKCEPWVLSVLSTHIMPGTVVISGMAPGADTFAAEFGEGMGCEVVKFPVTDWRRPDGSIDRSAGPRRNARMLKEGKPEMVLAFPGGDGTANMVKQARAAGVPVMRVTP